MASIAISGVFINEIRVWGAFSPIHLLSIGLLVGLFYSIKAARDGNIKRHRKVMKILFFSALILPGLFTLLPGRVINMVIFGG